MNDMHDSYSNTELISWALLVHSLLYGFSQIVSETTAVPEIILAK